MADDSLPDGFVLDENLPTGFVVDEPIPAGFVADSVAEKTPQQANNLEEVKNMIMAGTSLPAMAAQFGYGVSGGLARREAQPGESAISSIARSMGEAAPSIAAPIAFGAIAGGPPGIAVSALLGGGAELGAQLIGQATGGQKVNPSQIALTTALPPAAHGVSSAISGGAKILGREISSSASILMQAAEKYGIKLSPADITRSRLFSTVESAMEKIPFSVSTINEFRDNAIQALRQARDKVLSGFGTKAERELIGIQLKELVSSRSRAFYDQSKKLYDSIADVLPRRMETEVPINTLRTTAKFLLEKEKHVLSPIQDQEAIDLLTRFSGKTKEELLGAFQQMNLLEPGAIANEAIGAVPSKISFQNLIATRSKLGKLIADTDGAVAARMPGIKFQSSPMAGIYKQLYRAIDEDIKLYSDTLGGEVARRHDLAKSFYREGREIFDNKTIKKLIYSNPERAVDMFIRPGNITEIKVLRRAIGDKGMEGVKRAMLEKIFAEPSGSGGLPIFMPTRINKQLAKYGVDTLKTLFNSPGELDSILQIGNIAAAMNTAEALAGNTSGTARNVITFESARAFLNHPVKGTLLAIPSSLLAKFYTSDSGRKLLINGIKTPLENKKAAIVLASNIAGNLGIKLAKENSNEP